MSSFASFNLPEPLVKTLTSMRFVEPTPIQAQAIPAGLEGKDILGSAQTGTGKTAAFGIPLVVHLLNNPEQGALVLTPTRELAVQVLATCKQLLGSIGVKTALLIGGDPIDRQFKQLAAKPRLVVGTPGRINDHLERHTLTLGSMGFFVLDEADRMLDMGFMGQIQSIIAELPEARQTMMFSATLSKEVESLARSYLRQPVRIAVGATDAPAEKVEQEVLSLAEPEKLSTLLGRVGDNPGSHIVFVKTKYGTEKLAKKLREAGHEADAIHGDLRQSKRDRVIRSFRDGRSRILVATDVAARGLDIPHVSCVVNYDLPQCPEDYVHRIGRTGRAGMAGCALSFVTDEERFKWRMICRLIKVDERTFAPLKKQEKTAESHEGRSSESMPAKAASSEKKARFSDRKPRREFSDRRQSRGGDWGADRARKPKREWDRFASQSAAPRDGDDTFAPRPRSFKRPFGGRDEQRSGWGDRFASYDAAPRRNDGRDGRDNRGERNFRERDDRGGYERRAPRFERRFEGEARDNRSGTFGDRPPRRAMRRFSGEQDGGSFRPEGSFRPARFENRDERRPRREGAKGEFSPRPFGGDRKRFAGRDERRGRVDFAPGFAKNRKHDRRGAARPERKEYAPAARDEA